jgi:spore maturation protein CgeB
VDELIGKVRYYLEQEEERMRIAKAGYNRVVAGNHTYADRLAEILDHVGLK